MTKVDNIIQKLELLKKIYGNNIIVEIRQNKLWVDTDNQLIDVEKYNFKQELSDLKKSREETQKRLERLDKMINQLEKTMGCGNA